MAHPPERTWLATRLAESSTNSLQSTNTAADLRSVLTDKRIWLLSGFFLCILTVLYAWTFSAPVILQELTGWTIAHVGTLIAEIGLLGALAMLLTASSSDRTGERTWHIAVPCILMATGFIVGSLTHHPLIAIPAYVLTVLAYNAAQGPALTLPSIFLSGRVAAIGYATINMVAIGGGFLGPYWMGRARDLTGNYQRGLLTLAIPSALAAGLLFLLSRNKSAYSSVE